LREKATRRARKPAARDVTLETNVPAAAVTPLPIEAITQPQPTPQAAIPTAESGAPAHVEPTLSCDAVPATAAPPVPPVV
jgi:hypothetical protein